MAEKITYDTLQKLIGINKDLNVSILDLIPARISITTDISCKEIRHNRRAADFLRIEPWDNFSHTASKNQPVKILELGNELNPHEMPVQRAAWKGEEVKGQELEFLWEDGVQKYARFNSSPIYSKSGNIIGAIATFEDITDQKRVERALSKSDAKFRSLFQNMFEEMELMEYVYNEKGEVIDSIYVDLNLPALKSLGFNSKDEVIGKTSKELYGDIMEPYLKSIKKIKETGKPITFTSDWYGRNYIASYILLDEDHYMNIWLDISDIKRLSRQAEEERTRLQVIIDTIPTGFFIVEANGKVSLTNNEAKRIWAGVVPLENISDYVNYKGYWPKTGEQLQPEDWPAAQAILHGRETKGLMVDIERFDGTKGTILFSGAPTRGKSGNITGAVVAIQDITESRQTEKALRESEEQLALELKVAEHLQDLSIQLIQADNIQVLYEKVLDTAMTILHADFASLQLYHSDQGTSGALQLLGSRGFNKEAVGFWEWVYPDAHTTCAMALRTKEKVVISDLRKCNFMGGSEDLNMYLQNGVLAAVTMPLISRKGKLLGVFSTYWRKVHQLNNQENRNLDVLARQAADLIEQKLAEESLKVVNEELQLAGRRKDEFLGALSHEIRNPLASITLGLSLLERAPSNEKKAKQAMEIMGRQVAQLSRLVNDLLDVTRITRNLIVLKKEKVDLNELALRTVVDYQAIFEEKGVNLTIQQALTPLHMEADLTRLSQVLGNLLHNSVKFTKSGGYTRVTLSANELKQLAVIRVEDNGIGMSAATIESLFNPFIQAEASLDRSAGGLGLGLSLVKGLVELHGGTVEAYSEGLERGSVFTVFLPLLAEPFTVKAEESASFVPHRKKRVVVIEDIPDIAEVIKALLEEDGHDVKVANTGPEGIAITRDFRPDVVLCDIGLPGMDGYQVARTICADKALKDVLLISLTGYARPEDFKRAKGAGFQYQLAKPVDLETLKSALNWVK